MSPSAEKRKIAINASSNGLSFAVKIVVAFVVQPILVHGLGDERMGIWLLVNSIIAYMAMADLGIGAAVLRFVARFDGLDDKDSVNRIFNCSMLLFGCIGAILFLVTLVLAFVWHRPFGVDPEIASDTRWLLVLLGLNLAIGIPMGLYRSVLSGLGRYPTINSITVTSLLVRNVLFVCAIWMGGGLLAIGVSITFCGAGTYLAYAYFAYRRLPGLRLSREFIDSKTFKTLLGYSMGVFTAMTAGRIASASIPIVIGASLSPVFVTYYSIAAYIPTFAGDGLRTMLAVLTQSFSRMHAQGNLKEVRSVFLGISRNLLYLALPVAMGVFLFGYAFLTLWMGPKYAHEGRLVIVVLVAPLPLMLIQTLSLRLLHGFGKVKFVAVCMVIRACFTIGLSLTLIQRFGISGVALAVSATVGLTSIAIIVYACRVIEVGVFRLMLSSVARPIVPTTLLLILWVFVLHNWPATSWYAFFVALLAGLIPYGLLVCLWDRELRGLVRRALRGIGEALAKKGKRVPGEQA